ETTTSNALISCDGLGDYDWSDQAEEGLTNYALMAYSSLSSDSEVSNDSTCSKSCLETVKVLKCQYEQLLKRFEKSELMVVAYKTGLQFVEERLKFHKKNESVYVEKINGLKWDIQVGEMTIGELSLNKIIESQIVDNYKKGLGYNAVPPHLTRKFMPLKHDLSGLEEFVNEPIVNEPTVKKSVVETSEAKASVDKPKVDLSVNTARQVNTAHSKTTVNAARPKSYLSKTTHSTVKRHVQKNTAFKNSNFNQRVNTVKDKNVNTARPKVVVNVVRPKAIVNAVKGNNVNAVKASACWVWKPKTKVLDHVSKHNSASITLKKFDYIDAQGRSKVEEEKVVRGKGGGGRRNYAGEKMEMRRGREQSTNGFTG
ncbi:hypothetical protein Tco_1467565, partial [Tanacetum coccineum]